jgi:hypothetical protein
MAGVAVFLAALAVIFSLAANKWANDASPIGSVVPVDATVKSVQWDKGSATIYVVSLDSGATVLVDDSRPHLIGSRGVVERVTRDNGFVFYRFPE